MTASGPSSPQQAHLDSLTCARGIAAWLVVLYHIRSGMSWLPQEMLAFFAKGYLSVDFFFLLSGFVIYLSSHRALLKEGAAGIRPFLQRRLARIYPLYAVLLLLTIIFAALLTASGRDASNYPWRELPLHLFLMQNWGFTQALSWNHPAWSISTEMAAYLLFPLLVLATPIARASRSLLLVGIALSIGMMGLWLYSAGLRNLGEWIAHYGLIRCLFEFTAGTMLCAFWLQCEDGPQRPPILIAAAILIAMGAIWRLLPWTEFWAFPLMAAALIFLLAQIGRAQARRTDRRRASLLMRALTYVGEISYATYLSHMMLFIWFKIAFVDDAAHIPPWQMGMFLLLVLGASVFFYHLIEKPGKQLFALWFGSRRPVANPAALAQAEEAKAWSRAD